MGWNITCGAWPSVCRIIACLPSVALITLGIAHADIPLPSNGGTQLQNPQTLIDTLTQKIRSGSLSGKELADAYLGLCEANAQLRRINIAITACSKSIDTLDSWDARFVRSAIYTGLKNYPAALEDFAALTRLNPNDPSGHALGASIYWITGNIDMYASESDAAMSLIPNPIPALKARAELYFNNGYWSRALGDYDALLKREPDNPQILHFRGDAKSYLGNYDEGMLDYDRALELDPKAQLVPIAMSKVLSFFDRQKYDDAAAQAQIAADAAPDNAYNLLWLNLTRTHAGKFNPEDFSRRAASVNPSAWPYSIIAFELGTITEDKLFVAAGNGTSPQQVSGQKCEADFYLGEYKLNKDKSAAVSLLRDAAGSCLKGFFEANGAAFELRALGEDVKF